MVEVRMDMVRPKSAELSICFRRCAALAAGVRFLLLVDLCLALRPKESCECFPSIDPLKSKPEETMRFRRNQLCPIHLF